MTESRNCIEIRSRWDGSLLYSADAANRKEALERACHAGIHLSGAALASAHLVDVRLAGTDLTCANLSGANLAGADFSGAYLSGADFVRASLIKATLFDASLAKADLSRAGLFGAGFIRADLTGADLTGANLTGANLTRANLTRANLTGADLTGANLAGTNLTKATLVKATLDEASFLEACLESTDFTSARLIGTAFNDASQLEKAELGPIKADLWNILDAVPAEAAGLLRALREGRIDGRIYEGECACLVGTLANVRGVHYRKLSGVMPNSWRPAEIWFSPFRQGHTPSTSLLSFIAEKWIVEWQEEMAKAALAHLQEIERLRALAQDLRAAIPGDIGRHEIAEFLRIADALERAP